MRILSPFSWLGQLEVFSSPKSGDPFCDCSVLLGIRAILFCLIRRGKNYQDGDLCLEGAAAHASATPNRNPPT
jgi:hypothetical protein